MAIQKTEGIILRRQEIRETSLILTAFTRDLGKIQGVAKGVRGLRASACWYLEPLTLQAMVLYERRRSPWALISSCDLIDAFDPIRRDLTRLSYATLCLDLVDAMTANSDPHPEIFQLLLATLRALEQGADSRSAARFFEAHLMKASGLLPEPTSMTLSAGGRLSLQQILGTSSEQITRLRLSQAVEEELRRMLHGLFCNVITHELKSRTFLSTIGLENSFPSDFPQITPRDGVGRVSIPASRASN